MVSALKAIVWCVWALALAWFIVAGLVRASGPCEQYWYDGSAYGQAAWQWAPPGWSCTYVAQDSESAITVVTQPSWNPVLIGLLLLALPAYAFAARRRSIA